jgi:hypothetical protein
MKIVQKILLQVGFAVLAGCASMNSSAVALKAAPAPTAKTTAAPMLVLDTMTNILSNSLLELILLLIAVVTFLRYRALHKDNRKQRVGRVLENVMDLKNAEEDSAWYFKEDERRS